MIIVKIDYNLLNNRWNYNFHQTVPITQLQNRPKDAFICLQKVLVRGCERLANFPLFSMTTLVGGRKIDNNCIEDNADENSYQDEENVGENNNYDEDNAAENDDQSDGAGQIRRLWQPIKAFLLASAVILTNLIIMIMWALNMLMTIFRSASSSSYAL